MSAGDSPATVTISLGERLHEIDLDRLTPLARSIAEAIATDDPLRGPRPLRLESLVTVRELIEDAERRYPNRRDERIWYSDEELDQPHRITYESWAHYPAHSTLDAHSWLETEARDIPIGYRPVGRAGDGLLTQSQVLAAIRREEERQIEPATWRAYVARGQAPSPVRYVGRTALWATEDIQAWLDDRAGSRQRRTW